jgi:hypothetical protein
LKYKEWIKFSALELKQQLPWRAPWTRLFGLSATWLEAAGLKLQITNQKYDRGLNNEGGFRES